MRIGLILTGILTLTGGFMSAQPLGVGDKAPSFKMRGSDGKEYASTDLVGKKPVVIAWFPKAFTGG